MKTTLRRYFFLLKDIDGYLLLGTFLLISFGLVAIYSFELGKNIPDFSFFKRQFLAVVIGIILMLITAMIDYRFFLSSSKYFYILSLVVLVLVLYSGITFRGTRGWFQFGGFNFQVVEMVKITLLLFLVSFFSRFGRRLQEFRYVFLGGVFTFIPFFLVLLQPDLGSSMILFFLWIGFIFLVGTRRTNLLILFLGILFAGIFAWNFAFEDYQKDRLTIFLHPASDPLGAGYNVAQAQVALGSGGWVGRGIGLGTQSQLRFLPEAHTDFIIAVIGEELGFLGVSIVLFFYGFLLYRLKRKATALPDDSSALLLYGIIILFFTQMFINMSGTLGLLPVTGIALPFISYGGSSIIANFILIGFAESIIVHKK